MILRKLKLKQVPDTKCQTIQAEEKVPEKTLKEGEIHHHPDLQDAPAQLPQQAAALTTRQARQQAAVHVIHAKEKEERKEDPQCHFLNSFKS